MKSTMKMICAAFLLSLVSAGCYTQLATQEPSRDRSDDEDQYVSSDAADTSGSVVNNYYFGDDDYRYHRFNLSFSYYHPGRWAYYDGGIYDPWFGDPWYWPMGWRPYVLYPYPTWYPYDYYHGHHYWGYDGGSYYSPWYTDVVGVGRDLPHRTRTFGMTRGDNSRGMRSPLVTPGSPSATVGTTGSRVRTQGPSPQPTRQSTAAQTTEPTRSRTRGNDVPWWERTGTNADKSSPQQTATTQSTTTRSTDQQQPAVNSGRQRRVQQSPNTTPNSKPNSAPAATERPRRERREGTQPRQHASPPSQQSQPRYSPPANNGGGHSGGSSSGGSSSGRSSSNGGSSSGGGRQRER